MATSGGSYNITHNTLGNISQPPQTLSAYALLVQRVMQQQAAAVFNNQLALQNAAQVIPQVYRHQQMTAGPQFAYFGEESPLGGDRGLNGSKVLEEEVAIYRKQIKEGKMKMFSNSWTGEKFTGDVMTKPDIKSNIPKADPVLAGKEDLLEEYKQLSKELGMRQPHLEIEIFRKFLEKSNISVFELPAVIAYMDEMAAKESKDNSGWLWRPLREQDRCSISFGNRGRQTYVSTKDAHVTVGVSDYYGGGYSGSYPMVYDQTIPLHAMRKIAAIAKEFKDKVKLFVSDYMPLETIVYPDPFLMAVIPNPAMNRGVGRFVIDFWDEPGFGLEQQLGLK